LQPFIYTALPSRVIFGSGTVARAAEEIRALGCARALVLSTPEQRALAETLAEQIGPLSVGVFSHAAMHTPVDVSERAVRVALDGRADCVLAVGGGSTTGLGKAVALRTDLPQVVVPTTYAGSEATPILGETRDGLKTTQRTLKVLPEVVIYDVDLTLDLPPMMTATSGLNAIAHAVEALYTQDANPVISLIAEDGVRALANALPVLHRSPRDAEARSAALYGAWACGVCLGSVGMALHHKLCHTLGGSFDLPHAPTHAVVLAYAAAYNTPAAPDAMARLARALGAADAAQGLYDLARAIEAPPSLEAIGMRRADLDRAADLAAANPYWNPQPITRAGIGELLEAAFTGRRPA
jgi:maleylacetate reductase